MLLHTSDTRLQVNIQSLRHTFSQRGKSAAIVPFDFCVLLWIALLDMSRPIKDPHEFADID